MTNLRPLLPIVALVVLGGAAAHAGEFSLGSTHMLAQAGADSAVDVTVNFTDRGRTLRETAEGGDSTPPHATHNLRGADEASAPDANAHHATTETPAPKASTSVPSTTDSPHGVSISPTTAILRPSYRWQSLVPGTIK
jgi:cytoskeletal protein RodZ